MYSITLMHRCYLKYNGNLDILSENIKCKIFSVNIIWCILSRLCVCPSTPLCNLLPIQIENTYFPILFHCPSIPLQTLKKLSQLSSCCIHN